MPVPNLTLANTSVPTYKPVNGDESGRRFLELVDRAQDLFPDERAWISRNWRFGYRNDGAGFKTAIEYLEDITSSKRTDDQAAHLEEMRKYGRETWHWQ